MQRISFLHIFLSVLFLGFLPAFMAVGKNYTLFSGGKSDYVIVVSSQASESEKYAASELQSCLEKIGGVTLPIADCGKGRLGKRIIIGYNQDCRRLFSGERERMANDERFTYKNQKGDIVILGGKERGTMYGVFAFLENELGCRWLAEDCTVIPSREEYSFSQLNHSESPAFSRRSLLYSGFKDTSFRVHSRINERIKTSPAKPIQDVGGTYSFLSPHTMSFLLPVKKYYDAHPDYFALVEGKRAKDRPQPCFSHPDVFQICVDELRKVMRSYPMMSLYEVSALDNENYCHCPQCLATIHHLGSYTDLVLSFVNRVADAVQDEFPDKKIEFLAYSNTRTPPVSIKPRDNVVVRICDSDICHIHGFDSCLSEKAKQFQSELKRWKGLSKELYVWEYASDFSWYFIPFPNFYALKENLCSYEAIGIDGVFIEGNHSSENSEFRNLRIYLLTKLLWNPDCDLDAVVNDFMVGYYGASASYMRQYFDLIHSYIKDDVHMGTFAKYYEPYYSEDLIKKSLAVFEKAKRVADNETILHRIEMEELSVHFLKTIQTPKASKKDGSYERVRRMLEREKIKVGSQNSEKVFQKRVSPKITGYLTGPLLEAMQRMVDSSVSWMQSWAGGWRNAPAG